MAEPTASSIRHTAQADYLPHRVVVLGKSGFVGNELLRSLKVHGIEALGIGREEVDLTSPHSIKYLTNVLHDNDAVVFAAADVPVKSIEQFERNLTILRNFLEGAANVTLNHLIYVSSDAVYMDSDTPLTEISFRGPDNLHGIMHMAREVVLQNSKFRDILCIVRPTIIYGARDPHNSYGPCSFMRLSQSNQPIVLFGEGEERRDFIHISDVGEIIRLIIERKSVGSLNLATGRLSSFSEAAMMIREITRSRIPIASRPRVGPMPHNGLRPFDIHNVDIAFPNLRLKTLKEGLLSMSNGY